MKKGIPGMMSKRITAVMLSLLMMVSAVPVEALADVKTAPRADAENREDGVYDEGSGYGSLSEADETADVLPGNGGQNEAADGDSGTGESGGGESGGESGGGDTTGFNLTLVRNYNGANPSQYIKRINPGSGYTLPDLTEERTDYIHTGWCTKQNVNVEGYVIYDIGTEIMPDSGVDILYALWRKAVHTVSFDANGGMGTMEPVAVDERNLYHVPECTFTKENCVFAGWGVGRKLDAKIKYIEKETFHVTVDITLYAIWVPNSAYYPIDDIRPANLGTIVMGPNGSSSQGLKWRIIGEGSGKWLLISKDMLGEDKNLTDAVSYCDEVYNSFSEPEQAAVCSTTKTESGVYQLQCTAVFPASLDQAKLFLLSGAEAEIYFTGNADRKPGNWWLRTSADYVNSIHNGNCVDSNGDVYYKSDTASLSTRPAFVLDTSSILFTSRFDISRKFSAPTDGSSFGRFRDDDGTKKLTLHDNSRDGFAVDIAEASGTSVKVSYSGAQTGEKEYVSAMLLNPAGEIIGYASTDPITEASGTWDLTLPSGLADGTYTLKIFNEQKSGLYITDYASSMHEFAIAWGEQTVVKEVMPAAIFNATGPDCGTLTNVTSGMKYSIDGGSNWTDITGTSVTIASGISVTNGIKVYKQGNGTTTADSDVQKIVVTQAEEPEASSITTTACTTASNNDGTITGITTDMEYKKSDASSWIEGTGEEVTDLSNGTYYIRTKASGKMLASTCVEVIVEAYSAPSQVAAPTFSPVAGTYTEAKDVTISSATEGASIYYTTNGETPTASSTPYTGAIRVSQTTTIKAIAVKCGMTDSSVSTAVFTISSVTPPAPCSHEYDEGVTTKEPTIFAEGIRTYTCTRCHHTYTETIPKIDDGEDHSELIEDITDKEGKTKAEVKTEEKADGSKETTVTVGGQEVEKTVKDAEGNEAVETRIWIGGLKSSYTYTGSAIKPSFHVYDGTKKLSSGKDYSVSFKNNKNAGATATITVTFKGNYKRTSDVKLHFDITSHAPEAKDKKHSLSKATVKLSKKKYDYTGKEVIPAAGSYTLKLNGKTLKEGEDFLVSVVDNVNIGTAKIVFSAKEGNTEGYGGTKTATFRITGKKELKEGDGFTYSYSASVPYAKGGAKPAVVVKDRDDTLKAGTDYTVSYSKNTKVTNGATAVITIKGKGNYKGSVKKYFTITKQDISKLAGNIITADKVESKKGYKDPTVTITDLDGKKLKVGTDFAIVSDSYSGPDTNGVVTATIAGKGNYTGTASITYRYIKGAQQLGNVKAMKSLAGKTYTGRKVRLTNSDLTGILYTGSKSSPVYLIPGTDFKVVSYTNNTKTGTAKVTIQGIGAYGGTITLSFKIIAKKGDYKGSLVGGEWQ